ncbi:MAG: 4-hydroxy-tetrahydrodipicolinate synthase [Acidimicrobiales bacterium]
MQASGAPRFGGVVTAMVTPFDEIGDLDLDGARDLARWLVAHGSHGILLAGTTGEGPVLDDSEKADLWRCVREAVTVPVIANTGTNDTRHSIALTKVATQAKVDGVLAVGPYYNRPPQAGIRRHMEAIAAATSLPVVIYDIPVRTGRRIAAEVLVDLAREVSNIVGLKDATGDLSAAARIVARAPRGFELYCGDDDLTLSMLAIGAVGVISVASHWVGDDLAAMVDAHTKGDVVGARALNTKMLDSFEFETSESFPNPLPAKAVCRALGLRVGQCRDPLGPAPAELDRGAARLIEDLDIGVG